MNACSPFCLLETRNAIEWGDEKGKGKRLCQMKKQEKKSSSILQ